MTVHKFLFIFFFFSFGVGGGGVGVGGWGWGLGLGVGKVIHREKDSKDQKIIYKQNTWRILESESLTHSLDNGELFNTR